MRRSWGESSRLLALVITLAFFSAAVSSISVVMLRSFKAEIDALKNSISTVKSSLGERISAVEELIGPNSPLDRYITDLSYVKNVLSDLKNFEQILSDITDDPRAGYFRVLVAGTEKVWFEIERKGRKIFATEMFPGISPYKFYYFKAPNVSLEYIVDVPPDSSITVGKPGRVYLIFFGVGTPKARPVKVVKLTKTYYPYLKSAFNLYIPK